LQIKSSESSGITIILIGITLLLITFVVACIHLYGDISVLPVPSLMSSFGEGLSPLIEAAIRVMYLGLMGWIASTVTAKGLTALLRAKLLDKKNSLPKPQNPVISE
jgi:Na+/serine symporter